MISAFFFFPTDLSNGHFINIIEGTVSLCLRSSTNRLVNLSHLMKSMGSLLLASGGAQGDIVSELRF